MIERAILIALCATLVPSAAVGQTVYESSKGQSSFVLNQATGVVSFNFTDANVKVGYLRSLSSSPWRFGGEFKLGFKNGFASIVQENEVTASDGRGSFLVGYQWEPDIPPSGLRISWHNAYARVRFARGKYSVATPGETGSFVLADETFNGVGLDFFYNAFGEIPFVGEFLFGAAIGYGRANNVAKLASGEVCTRLGTASGSMGELQFLNQCQSRSIGEYVESNELTVSADFLWFLGESRFAVAAIVRHDETRYTDAVVPGVGIFLTEENAPLKLIGGLTVEFDDGKVRAGAQIGYAF